MKFIDVEYNNVSENVLAETLLFQNTADSLVLLSNMNNKLSASNNLNDALKVIDNLEDMDITSSYDDVTYKNINHLVFNNVELVGENKLKINNPADENLDAINNIVNNLNDQIVIYEGDEAMSHTFIHNLDTEFFTMSIFVKNVIGWQNNIVPVTIIDQNTIRVDLHEPKKIRMILNKIDNISKTYGT